MFGYLLFEEKINEMKFVVHIHFFMSNQTKKIWFLFVVYWRKVHSYGAIGFLIQGLIFFW